MSIGILSVGLEGTSLLPKERELLAHPKVGGVSLFKENWLKNQLNAKEELQNLISEIRSINPDLIIMVDHEGGKVWRFEPGFTKLPSAKTYGELYDKEGKAVALQFAFDQAYLMANELLEFGIDISLAPVVDLDADSNVIGQYERAFHSDPELVVQIAEQFIRGMNAGGMPATLKHFPGHGSCKLDSHIYAPIDNRSFSALQQDLFPFKKLCEADLNFAIMSNHVLYPAVDKLNTCCFSETWLKGCLRMGCGFNNLIMSDCLAMKGADIGTLQKRIIKAQEAGHDLLLVTHQYGENLNELLSLLDEVPDCDESVLRRERFLGSILRRNEPLSKQKSSGIPNEKSSLRSENTPRKERGSDQFNTHHGII